MKTSTKLVVRDLGEVLLLSYLILVMAIAILRLLTGYPTIGQLASSPDLLARGEWWRLITSGLVVNGPAVPQIVAIGVLGTLGIYFGGSWAFWSTALAGHFLGTLLAYAGFAAVWLTDHAAAAQYLADPDYGVSLIWCAALGAFVGVAWQGEHRQLKRPARPWLVAAGIAVMALVTVYSDEMAAVQHLLAFGIGLLMVGAAGRSRRIYRPRRRLGAAS